MSAPLFTPLATANTNPYAAFDFANALSRVGSSWLSWLTFFVSVAAVVYVISAGIRYITSNGDVKQTDQARRSLIAGIIGIIVIVATYLFISVAASISRFLIDGANSPQGVEIEISPRPASSPVPTRTPSPPPNTTPGGEDTEGGGGGTSGI
jgi:succinate dehydrogenase/fumarate reductase cytochrome b subunit